MEQTDKDSINSFHLNDLKTTRDVFCCKTEDSSDIEEIGDADSSSSTGEDNHLLEDDALCIEREERSDRSDENSRDTAGIQQWDIRKLGGQPRNNKSIEKEEKVRCPAAGWSGNIQI